ncbi:MAG: site-2 protease family protein, partial [Kiritimatiellia bacterium]|nr:site-2 protease family protein [Kiritimatiellia bacterium]
LNLLPIPVLDGGHILFSSIEGLTRRPVHAGFVNWTYRVFATLLIGLFLLLTVRDIVRLVKVYFRSPSTPAATESPVEPTDEPEATPE